MIWHWKIAETLARKFKQQFKQLSVHFYFVAFFWKTGLLILAFKCDIYGRVFSRPWVINSLIRFQGFPNPYYKILYLSEVFSIISLWNERLWTSLQFTLLFLSLIEYKKGNICVCYHHDAITIFWQILWANLVLSVKVTKQQSIFNCEVKTWLKKIKRKSW